MLLLIFKLCLLLAHQAAEANLQLRQFKMVTLADYFFSPGSQFLVGSKVYCGSLCLVNRTLDPCPVFRMATTVPGLCFCGSLNFSRSGNTGTNIKLFVARGCPGGKIITSTKVLNQLGSFLFSSHLSTL